jgi:hypothetical protein
MSFIAQASRRVAAPPEALFDKLADFSSWFDWMPKTFRPTAGPRRVLRERDRMRIRIDGAPISSPIRVSVVDRPREVAWTGGVRGILWAEHRFLFTAADDGGTEARSVETWSGVMAPVLRPIVKRVAERIGREQLEALAAQVTK